MPRKITYKRAARAGAHAVSDVISLILRVIGMILLIAVCSGVVFSCIFAVYVKTNLMTQSLDVRLDEYQLSQSSNIYYLDPETQQPIHAVTVASDEYRVWAAYAEIPLFMEHALVAIEDKRFYEHNGVDWYRTVSAFSNMFVKMKDKFGGSTITQQLIKNLTGEDEVTISRTLQEIFSALEFEREYDKKEIIEWYLNRVYFGSG
ncbi:MAG: transglycosylase domain-containing protein, partial [Oscillospiraceae bacterium]|nr:transglycosylase domain-containing protein [Oscillospiraceae bacterium]